MTVKTQKTFRVSVPPRSSGSEIHLAIAALGAPHDEVHLLAGSARFVTPREICGLRALLDHAAQVADRVVFDCPTNESVHRYLARVDFYSELPHNVELTIPVPALRRRDRRERLIEVTRIRTSDDVEALTDRVWKLVRAQLGVGTAAVACTTAVAAATENALEHAKSPIGALVSAQRYESTGLELAVVDLGLGIPTTLAANTECADLTDLQSLERALEDGVSSANDPGRGAGLAELVRGVGRPGTSTLQLGSGQAELVIGWQGGLERRSRSAPAYAIRGTWISVRLEA